MALDFDEAFAEETKDQTPSNSQSVANLPSTDPQSLSIEDIAEGIINTQREIEKQTQESKEIQRRYEEELQKLEKMQADLSRLIAFFEDHEQAIQTSMYATSKYVIEEQAAKSISEIKKVGAEAQQHLKTIEDQAANAAKKSSTKSKFQKSLTVLQVILIILIFIKVCT